MLALVMHETRLSGKGSLRDVTQSRTRDYDLDPDWEVSQYRF